MDIWLKIQQYTFHTSSVSKESTTLQVLCARFGWFSDHGEITLMTPGFGQRWYPISWSLLLIAPH